MGVHEDAPAEEEEPEVQGEHASALPTAYVLAAHVSHDVPEPVALEVPLGQGAHALVEKNCPPPQTTVVHVEEPAAEVVPLGHAVHEPAPL